jgi:ferredoxin-NADP reductase
MKLQVQWARLTTPDILHVQLVHPTHLQLPEWTAGAHVDLRLPDGRIRQYSLCGNPKDRSHYQIAIKREAAGRGASIWAHENLKEGSVAHVSAPRNNLPVSENASRHVMIAGGIGITPFVAMAHELSARAANFELHYCARSPSAAPFIEDLKYICGPRLHCWFSSEPNRFDPKILRTIVDGTHVYCCGPERLLNAIDSIFSEIEWPIEQRHTESFQATLDENFQAEPFDAYIPSIGKTFRVPADRSLLDVLREHGIAIASSCELGVCGACECGYRAGTVIHRDKVLPVHKRQHRLTPCVSRAHVSVTLDI